MGQKNNKNSKKRTVNILISLFVMLSICSASSLGAITLGDQITDVKLKSTGERVELGNVTISIWDSMTGGTNLYNYTFVDAIRNGSWTVMLGEAPGPALNLNFNQLGTRAAGLTGNLLRDCRC